MVFGAIGAKYAEMGTARSNLGYPTSNEKKINGGFFQEFEHGNIYFSPASGAHVIYYGNIFNEWGKNGWEQGRLGWPTSDMKDIPAGGKTITFQHGTLDEIFGQVRERKN